MLNTAKKRLPSLDFEIADANTWLPSSSSSIDLVFANASYQWIPGHVDQLKRVIALLKPGAVVAVQMPDNVQEETHRLMKVVAEQGQWSTKLSKAAREPLPSTQTYHEAFSPLSSRVNIWRTTYFHHLKGGARSIVEFVKSTGLKPFLDPLSEQEQQAFLSLYTDEIKKAYPPMSDGTSVLLPYPRLFIVVEK
jgi:trans-aconitate 2-methyltransferase